MSFLKKFLTSKDQKSFDASKVSKFKNRAERVDLKHWHEVLCESMDANIAFTSPSIILNLSLSGVALDRKMLVRAGDVGTEIKVRLIVKGRSFSVLLKFAHISPTIVGATFVSPSLEFVGFLKSFFMVEVAALKLSSVAPQFVKPVEKGQAHLLEADKATNVYYVEDEGQIKQFNLSFFGNTIEYLGPENWRFGQAQFNPEAGPFNSTTKFNWDKAWSPHLIALTRRFIDAIPKISDRERKFFNSVVDRIPLA